MVEKSARDTTAERPTTTSTVVQRPQPSLSFTAETTTSRMEMSEVNPAITREPKKRMPTRAPMGAWEISVGNATKARPIPLATTSSTRTPEACAMKPSAENTPMPARISKPELDRPTTRPEPVRFVRFFR